jgi:hypothetical protein
MSNLSVTDLVPSRGQRYDVKLYKDTKRHNKDISELSPMEKLAYISSLSWDELVRGSTEHVAVLQNGTIATSNLTGEFDDIKAAADNYAALGGDYFGADFGSNASTSVVTSQPNFTHAPVGLQPVMNNTMMSPNASAVNEVQLGHQDIQEPPPYDILNLGTSYILGNIGQSGNTVFSNVSSSLRNLNTTSGDGGATVSKRSHRRGHAAFHQHRSSQGRQSVHAERSLEPNMTPFTNSLHKRVDGPIQCGPGSPCKDDSCCGPEGKCGYKEHNCGAGCTS